MSVSKSIELRGEGASIQSAVLEAIDRAQLSLEGMTSFEVLDIQGVFDDAGPTFQVRVRVWFTLLEKMHG